MSDKTYGADPSPSAQGASGRPLGLASRAGAARSGVARIRPYLPGDVRLVDPRPEMRHEFRLLTNQPFVDAEPDSATHRAATLLVDNYPAACAGVFLAWPRFAMAWAMFSDIPPKYARLVLHACEANIETAAREWSLSRLESFCVANFDTGERFLKKLGFSRVPYLLKRRVTGRDYWMWEKVIP